MAKQDPLTDKQLKNILAKATKIARSMHPRRDDVDADDVATDAVSRIFLGLRDGALKLPPADQLDAFLRAAIRNQLVNFSRWARRDRKTASKFYPLRDWPSTPRPADVVSAQEHQDHLRAAISQLPEEEKHVVELLAEGISTKEIAQRLKKSQAWVFRMRSAAMLGLKRLLADTVEPNPAKKAGGKTDVNASEPDSSQEFELYIDPGNASSDDVKALLRAINDLHVAAGGLGLEFKVDGLFVVARQEVSA